MLDRVVEISRILPARVRPPVSNGSASQWDVEFGVEYRVREVWDILSRIALSSDICL